MLIKRVVINASPLIVLFKSQQADLLPQLFSEIIVPVGVWDEVTGTAQNDAASRQLSKVPWAQRVEIGEIPPEVAAWDLGKGESEVLSLALSDSNLAAIVDDRAARRCCQALSILTIGTGRLIILAKQRGLIDSVSPRIQALQDAGLWLSDNLVNLLKQQAGE
jgi:predicted nucleic acid-binding protein